MVICGALHDLVAFVQLKKHEKHPWRSVNFSKIADLPNRATHHIYVGLYFSLTHPEAYFKPSETFTMKLLRLKAVNYFCKKAPSWMLDWFLNTPLPSQPCVAVM